MNKSFKIIATGWLILIVSVLINSCDSNYPQGKSSSAEAKNPKENAEDHNDAKFTESNSEKDAQYLVDAYSDGLYEIEFAKQAVQYAEARSVKDLAATLIADHVNINATIEKLAAQKQISIPKALSDDQWKEIKKYKEKRSADYSKAYTEKLVTMHKDAIAMYEKAGEKASDPDIRNFFHSSLPELRKHADMAMNVKDRLK